MRRIPALRELLSTLKHRLSADRCHQLTGSAATASLSTTASAPAGRPVPKVSVDVVVTGFRKPAVGPPSNPECLKPGFVKRSIPHSLQAIQSSPSILAVYNCMLGYSLLPSPLVAAALTRAAELQHNPSNQVAQAPGSAPLTAARPPTATPGLHASISPPSQARPPPANSKPSTPSPPSLDALTKVVLLAHRDMDLLLHTYTGPQLLACVLALCRLGLLQPATSQQSGAPSPTQAVGLPAPQPSTRGADGDNATDQECLEQGLSRPAPTTPGTRDPSPQSSSGPQPSQGSSSSSSMGQLYTDLEGLAPGQGAGEPGVLPLSSHSLGLLVSRCLALLLDHEGLALTPAHQLPSSTADSRLAEGGASMSTPGPGASAALADRNPHPHGSQAKTKDMKAKDGPVTAGHPAVSLCQALHQAGYWHAAHWAALTRILNNTALKHNEKQAVDTALAWAAGMESSHA